MAGKRFARVGMIALVLGGTLAGAAEKPYDSKRDPEQDFAAAKQQASATHKNILLTFGGNWCPPCMELDGALRQDAALAERIERSYVVVHVDVGGFFGSRKASAFEKRFPKFKGVPHVIVLTADGKMLHDEVRGDFMTNDNGKGISHKVLGEFLDKWAPADHG